VHALSEAGDVGDRMTRVQPAHAVRDDVDLFAGRRPRDDLLREAITALGHRPDGIDLALDDAVPLRPKVRGDAVEIVDRNGQARRVSKAQDAVREHDGLGHRATWA
jgi:hypothetical protein